MKKTIYGKPYMETARVEKYFLCEERTEFADHMVIDLISVHLHFRRLCQWRARKRVRVECIL